MTNVIPRSRTPLSFLFECPILLGHIHWGYSLSTACVRVIVCTLRIYTMHATDVYSAAFVPPPQLFIAIAFDNIYRIPFIFCFFIFIFCFFDSILLWLLLAVNRRHQMKYWKNRKLLFFIHFPCEDYIKVSIESVSPTSTLSSCRLHPHIHRSFNYQQTTK